MTQKKQNILTTALRLFVDRGYDATSTRQIANEAGVSEALIFRHYKNKEGLLLAIFEKGGEMISERTESVVEESDPRLFIFKLIELPLQLISEEDIDDFWPLLMDMKHKHAHAKAMMHENETLKILKERAVWALGELGYEQPEQEVALLMFYIDGVSRLLKTGETAAAQSLITYLQSANHYGK